MSISLNTTISTSLPVSDTRNASVIKKSVQHPNDAVKADFSALLNGASEPASADIVSGEEKEFFASMFPAASDAIRSYAGYSPNGVKKPVQLGTLIDMKG